MGSPQLQYQADIDRHWLHWTDQSSARLHVSVGVTSKLQALVYDIPPSITAVFSYAIGSRKLSANEQFFVGSQKVVGLLQTTQIKQGVSFIAVNKVHLHQHKLKPQSFGTLFSFLFYPGSVDASHVYVRALALCCFYSHISTRTFRWPRRWTAARR